MSIRPTYAVIGDPVEHSLSPRIFASLFSSLDVDAHYTALRVAPDELAETLQRLRGGALAGLSVTLPHKETIVPLLDELHPLAARIGAVNCVVRDPEGKLRGYNTDVIGFQAALDQGPTALAGSRVVILGAGGAGRAAAFTAAVAGAKSVAIFNRTHERAVALALDLVACGYAWPGGELARMQEERPIAARPLAGPAGQAFVIAPKYDPDALDQALAHADLLVNATSVGLTTPGADPLPPRCALLPQTTVLDMVYRPIETALLRRAKALGCPTIDGLWMLVNQALEQLRLWLGRLPPGALGPALHEQLVGESA